MSRMDGARYTSLRRWIVRVELFLGWALAAIIVLLIVASFFSQDPRHGGAYALFGAAFLVPVAASFLIGAWSLKRTSRFVWVAQILPASGLSLLIWGLL